MSTCRVRVWDNGDMDSCGAPTVFAEFCSLHFEHALAETRRQLAESEANVARLVAEVARLESAKVSR